jgi:hypothetical protein
MHERHIRGYKNSVRDIIHTISIKPNIRSFEYFEFNYLVLQSSSVIMNNTEVSERKAAK